MKCLGSCSREGQEANQASGEMDPAVFPIIRTQSLSLSRQLPLSQLLASGLCFSGRISPHRGPEGPYESKCSIYLLEVVPEKKKDVLIVKGRGKMLNGLGQGTCPVLRQLPWLKRWSALTGQPGARSSLAQERKKDTLPKERGVGSMGTDQNWLPRSITLTEVNEMRDQGIITQCSYKSK